MNELTRKFKGKKRIKKEDLDPTGVNLLFMSQVEAPKGFVREWLELGNIVGLVKESFVYTELTRFNMTKKKYVDIKLNWRNISQETRYGSYGHYIFTNGETDFYNDIRTFLKKEELSLMNKLESLRGIVKNITIDVDVDPVGIPSVSIGDVTRWELCYDVFIPYFDYVTENNDIWRNGTDKEYLIPNPYLIKNGMDNKDPYNLITPAYNSACNVKSLSTFGISEEVLNKFNEKLNKILKDLKYSLESLCNNQFNPSARNRLAEVDKWNAYKNHYLK